MPTVNSTSASRYDNGRGVPQDDAEALKWYRKAAEQGYALAQTNLGFMYDHGRGVPQDYVLAHMWFNLAVAAAGNSAMARDIAAKMTPAQIAELKSSRVNGSLHRTTSDRRERLSEHR